MMKLHHSAATAAITAALIAGGYGIGSGLSARAADPSREPARSGETPREHAEKEHADKEHADKDHADKDHAGKDHAEATHRPHEKLRTADAALDEAEVYLKESTDDFYGHKAECLKRINEARVQISLILEAEKSGAAAQHPGHGSETPARK